MLQDNKLYQYKGGGYEGCFWEWNYAVVVEGEFHDIYSSGDKGCPTGEDLAEYLEDDGTVYIYSLTVVGLTDFAEASEPGSVLAVIAALVELGIAFDIRLTCAGCECVVSLDEMRAVGLASAGGTATQYTSLVCLGCAIAIEENYL